LKKEQSSCGLGDDSTSIKHSPMQKFTLNCDFALNFCSVRWHFWLCITGSLLPSSTNILIFASKNIFSSC